MISLKMFEVWGIALNFNSENFAKKYATKYTMILAVLLVVPLVVYLMLLLQVDKAKVKLSLERQVQRVILSMDTYHNDEKIYKFPRYKEFNSALYSKNYETIFSTLDFEPSAFSIGFYKQQSHYYLIYSLPSKYYFGSKYLLVSTEHRANEIYMFVLLGVLLILITLFLLSLHLLKNFSKPFEAINQQLDNFIKDSMHEINTPLSIININSDMFANKYGDNKYLQRIKSASKTLSTIYDDMDYLIKQGRVEHKVKQIDVSEFIQNRIDYFKGVANLKHLLIVADISPNISYRFSKTKLQRIVDNTISNAIKYSHDNSSIEVKLYKNNQQMVFSVEDHGVGIDDLKKIFSRYYRENQSKGGFGIGLNIVKDIIEEEGIDLTVHSTVDVGSLFIYTFPYNQNL